VKQWTWVFEEDGGYDTLYSAVSVCRDGNEVFVIERDVYPSSRTTFPLPKPISHEAIWEDNHSFPEKMRRDAEFIVDALNEKEERDAAKS